MGSRYIRQGAYATKIQEKAGRLGCNPCATPMDMNLKLLKEGTTPSMDATEYRCIIGSPRYLCNCRPDLAFAMGYLSRFMEASHQVHLAAVKQVLPYVAGTMHLGVHYYLAGKKEAARPLLGYSDSDMVRDVNDWKSTSGLIFLAGGGPGRLLLGSQ